MSTGSGKGARKHVLARIVGKIVSNMSEGEALICRLVLSHKSERY
jgi:hypothetical protein